MIKKYSLFLLSAFLIFGCGNNSNLHHFKSIGQVTLIDSAFYEVISQNAKIELLAEGFIWSEGPVWINEGNYLLFSDVPENKIYKWSESEGLTLYLEPSGYTGKEEKGEGSNGLLINPEGKLVICQHGDRRVAYMNATLNSPKPEYVSIADYYKGSRFNSPNDAAIHNNGDIYFTDPPYGLTQQDNDPSKELKFNGVYKSDRNGNTVLLDDQLTRPNGIAFSPDQEKLYVANSDPQNPFIKVYKVNEEGLLEDGKIFFDAKNLQGENVLGLPDGMKVNRDGILFATAPGGVLVITPEGNLLGIIDPGVAVANVAIGGDGYLYLTSHIYLARIKLK